MAWTEVSGRFRRMIDRAGYIRFRHWRIYGEYGLARRTAVVWLYGEPLTVSFEETALADYRVSYQPDLKHLRTVDEPKLFMTPHRAPQLPLWEWGEDKWHKVVRLPPPRIRQRRSLAGTQEALDMGV